MKDITSVFLEAMRRNNWSYADLSKMTGISKSSLQRYFTGETGRIPIDCVEPICNALGLDPAETLGWTISQDTRRNRILEAYHQNPKLGLLFDRQSHLSDADIEFMNQMVNRILGERDND